MQDNLLEVPHLLSQMYIYSKHAVFLCRMIQVAYVKVLVNMSVVCRYDTSTLFFNFFLFLKIESVCLTVWN